MSTHNIGFYEDFTKNIFELSSNMHLISSAEMELQCRPGSLRSHLVWICTIYPVQLCVRNFGIITVNLYKRTSCLFSCSSSQVSMKIINTAMVLDSWIDMSGQTVPTQIRLLQENQSKIKSSTPSQVLEALLMVSWFQF